MEKDGARLPITAVLLAYNEEIHLERCLSRLAPFVERVVIALDPRSDDRTEEIARAYGADILRRPFTTHAEQFRWAMAEAEIATPWTLRIDGDEYFEDGVFEALREQLAALPDDVAGLTFKRKFIFQNRWIRHGRYYPVVLLRLWRTGAADIEQRLMDEHMILTRGRAAPARGGDLVDHNLKGVDSWTAKHNRYATLAMLDALNYEFDLFPRDGRLEAEDGRAARNRRLKTLYYRHAPLYLRALALYLYRYVIRLGFLDGREGLLFHFLHGLWLFVLIDAKIAEARALVAAEGVETFRRKLPERYGLRL